MDDGAPLRPKGDKRKKFLEEWEAAQKLARFVVNSSKDFTLHQLEQLLNENDYVSFWIFEYLELVDVSRECCGATYAIMQSFSVNVSSV